MNLNDVRTLITVLSLLLFLGLMAWTWWPARRRAFDAAARLPFDGDSPPAAADPARPPGAPAPALRSQHAARRVAP